MGDRFTYRAEEMCVARSQCEGCMLYREGDMMHCEKYPDGKPQEIRDTMKICPFLFSHRRKGIINNGER